FSPMISTPEGNTMCSSVFYYYPELAKRGVAIPINDLDRRDIAVPSVIDSRDKKQYRYRDCQRWLKKEVEKLQSQRVK
ncbi:MAG: hypothetical protein KGL95_00595, partial [Patescibacteria group bacterium]|nr:hypothetical protein [Patescibacteria group bacterium]